MKILNSLHHLWNRSVARGAGFLALAGLALAFSLALLDSVSGSETLPTSPYGAAVQGGPPPALALLFTGEVMGWTEPCG